MAGRTGETMKAFVTEIGRLGFMDKPVPRPGPLDAVARTTTALIPTSDSPTVRDGTGPLGADATFQTAVT
ncbi:hypothetical protein AB0L05_16950 [Nonomuraea pusilla]|uniref:hypothetical protein n=1 Tax=Nonomuraea pusilla TaxID=46177 RepID=UPI003327D05A